MAEVETDLELAQRYRLVRRIAFGGMGTVWEAEDTVLHRPVAVKLLSDALSTNRRYAERFRREAQASARLSHPNIASVFDYLEDDGRQFIVMELIDGVPLSELLERKGRLDPAEAVRVSVAIASALQAAHDGGIVHRDVKPGNVMLTRSGQVKVLDFGIAAAAGAPLTATGARMGTATYLAPEQAVGEAPTPASDVYSLGVVLYEMLSGRPPFTGDTPVGVAAQHVNREPPSLDATAPNVPGHVIEACRRALAKDPAARPASAASFAEMLVSPGGAATSPLDGVSPEDPGTTLVLPPVEPTAVLGAEPPAPRPAARPTRRNVVPLALVVMLVALGLLGLVLGLTLGRSGKAPEISSNVRVPSVVGMKKGDAEKVLRDKGLKVEVVAVEGVRDVVVRPLPPAGASVAPGSTVTLYVGAAPHNEEHGNGGGDHGNGKGHGGDD